MSSSPALGGRRQQVVVHLPPGYTLHPRGATRSSTSCTARRAARDAFLQTSCAWAWSTTSSSPKHKRRPLILVMPFGLDGRSRTRNG